MKRWWLLFRKDVALEARSREVVSLTLSLATLLAVIASFGLGSAFLSSAVLAAIFPVLLWVIFLFTATVSLGKTLEYDLAEGALDTLITSGTSFITIYLSKLGANITLSFCAHLVSTAILALLLNVEFWSGAIPFIGVSVLVLLGYSELTTLLVAVSSGSRLRGMLLPLVLLPLVAPLFFAGIELSREAFASGHIALESPWVSLLIGLDVVYLLAGLNLYEHAARE